MGWKTNTEIMLKYFILNIVSCYLYAIVAKMYQLFWLFFFFLTGLSLLSSQVSCVIDTVTATPLPFSPKIESCQMWL